MGHSAGVSLWERYWEKTLGQAGPDSAKGWSPALLRERGQLRILWVLVRSQGCSAGAGPLVQRFQSFAECRQEKCCVLGAKQGLSNKGSLHISCKIPRRA